ncbi:hypothetical protein GGR56DRAFT_691288 [Xylariaceae sp. FL0804]|nr:hypothetical protein GGR56DRAFT_691288 [Xylariaceae sp. FL0804]
MARKGSAKVRTGCLTCKTRKVKCDEGKPACLRCTSTGRRCDGYLAAQSRIAPGSGTGTGAGAGAGLALAWHRPRQLFPHATGSGPGAGARDERRALQFFSEAAAPFLAGPQAGDPYFWTHLVLQFSSFEPAVRHAVVALSALYEEAVTTTTTTRVGGGGNGGSGSISISSSSSNSKGLKFGSSPSSGSDSGSGNSSSVGVVQPTRPWPRPGGGPPRPRRARGGGGNATPLALGHYNAAIRALRGVQSEPLVLLVCVLFVCLEFLRGERLLAVQHCRHGLRLLERGGRGGGSGRGSGNSGGGSGSGLPAWTREHLEPIFRRLSVFPFFFGGSPASFVVPAGLDAPLPAAFGGGGGGGGNDGDADAAFFLDGIMTRTIALSRRCDAYRLAPMVVATSTGGRADDADADPDAPPADLVVEQHRVRKLLCGWHARFLDLLARARQQRQRRQQQEQVEEEDVYGPGTRGAWTETETEMMNPARTLMAVKHRVLSVMVETVLSRDETAYDAYVDSFCAAVDLAAALAAATGSSPYQSQSQSRGGGVGRGRQRRQRRSCAPPGFTFETGFLPLLYYVALRCRCLATRLRALALMGRLGAARENLWERAALRAAGRRAVEIEHGAVLVSVSDDDDDDDDGGGDGGGGGGGGGERLAGPPACPGFPPDGARIRDVMTDPEPVVWTGPDGEEKIGRMVSFFMRSPSGECYLRPELIPDSR